MNASSTIRVLLFGLLAALPGSQAADLSEIPKEGSGQPWFWDAHFSDFIAFARITYDPKKYIVIDTRSAEKPIDPEYYFDATITFDQIVYANSASRYVEDLNAYVQKRTQPRLLIRARRVYTEHMKPDEIRLEAENGEAFKHGAVLCSMTQSYLFPIAHLVLESIVPADKQQEAQAIIQKRKHNLVSKP